MFETYRNIPQTIFSDIFLRHNMNYDLQSNSQFATPELRSAFHGSESISY